MMVVDNWPLLQDARPGCRRGRVLLSTQFIRDRGMAVGEYYGVLALVTVGMMVTRGLGHHDIFVASSCRHRRYILTGFNRRDKLSNEAASSTSCRHLLHAILVYGMAWL